MIRHYQQLVLTSIIITVDDTYIYMYIYKKWLLLINRLIGLAWWLLTTIIIIPYKYHYHPIDIVHIILIDH